MRPNLIERNSDLFGVGALILVIVSGGAFVTSFLASGTPVAEALAAIGYLGGVATGLAVLVGGTRGRGAGMASVIVAAPVGLVMLGLIVVRSAWAAEGSG